MGQRFDNEPIIITDHPSLFLATTGLLSILNMALLLFVLVTCFYSRKQPDDFDSPVAVDASSTKRCGGGRSSMAKLRRLALAVAFFSAHMWSTAWAVQWTLLVYPVTFASLAVSIRVYRSAVFGGKAFASSPVVSSASKLRRILLWCSGLYFVCSVLASIEVSGALGQQQPCGEDVGSSSECKEIRATYLRLGEMTILSMLILVALTIGLALALEDLAGRIQTVGDLEEHNYVPFATNEEVSTVTNDVRSKDAPLVDDAERV